MNKDDRLYLIHIKECIDKIDRYSSIGRAEFFGNTMVQDAIVRNLQTLDLERIWHIVEFDLPGLRTHVNSLLVESGELC